MRRRWPTAAALIFRAVPVRASGIFHGDGWMGVKMRDASVVKGVGVLPMFAGLIGLLLLLGAFAATWCARGVRRCLAVSMLPRPRAAISGRIDKPGPFLDVHFRFSRDKARVKARQSCPGPCSCR